MNGCKHYRPDNSPDCFEYPDAPKYCKGVNCYYKRLKETEEILACFWLDAANLIRTLKFIKDVIQKNNNVMFEPIIKEINDTLVKSYTFRVMKEIEEDDE